MNRNFKHRKRWMSSRRSMLVFLIVYAMLSQSLNAQDTNTEEFNQLLDRLHRAESLINRVEQENRLLRVQMESEFSKTKSSAENVEDSGQFKFTESDATPIEKPDKKLAKKLDEKQKEWYEKLKVRGYTQFRYNHVTDSNLGSASPNHAGDASISSDQELFIRRARVVVFGDISDHLSVYFQPDFAATPDAQSVSNHFTQLRDWYGDIHFDKTRVHRIRLGQSKVPYGWENMQSSQNRLYLDRNDAFNSATKNERDLGGFYYWTPAWAQETFQFISDEGLKGSGNYGVFGFGAYNGQGGSLRELNDEMHLVSRLTIPRTLSNGQIIEAGIQGYTGRYVVAGAPIVPLGIGAAETPEGTRGTALGEDGLLDQRLGWTFVSYPQPLGFQAEYTIGRGPELNDAQTAVERGTLHGGYLMMNYRHITGRYGELWPFIRWQHYEGGYKNAVNAPSSSINEWNFGVEWQIRKELELVCEYLITDRTNLSARSSGVSYEQFNGDILRFQFQVNY